jgi:hypothetical protein
MIRPSAIGSGSMFAVALVFGGRSSMLEASMAAHRAGGASSTAIASRVEVAAPAQTAVWAEELPAITVRNVNTLAEANVRLYTSEGAIDGAAMSAFKRVANANEEEGPLATRTVQLAVRVAYFFKGGGRIAGAPIKRDAQVAIEIISAYRPDTPKHKNGPHGTGSALDFRVVDVKAGWVAAWLRKTAPRAGVGIYTHPRTQYVHLDVREESFHWIDGSPPGVTWREQRIPDYFQRDRDASYRAELDLPFSALPKAPPPGAKAQ